MEDKENGGLWCVYMHTCKENNKKYIGQSKNLKNRWANNGASYLFKEKDGSWRQPLIARAILSHGWDGFEHEIIAESLTKEEADQMEINLIKQYDTLNPKKGYNIRHGGSNGSISEESKDKMRKTIGDSRIKEKNSFYGKTHTEETKERIRQHAIKNSKKRDISGSNNFCFLHYIYTCLETGDIYNSARKAAEAVGVTRACIAKACNSPFRTSGGYHWTKTPVSENKET